MLQNQGSDLGNTDDQPNVEAALKSDCKIAKAEKPPLTFDELMSTLIDFSAYGINNLKIDNLTQEHLNNPEGHEYPFDLCKPLPLNEDQGRQVVPINYFIKNELGHRKHGSIVMESNEGTHVKVMKWYDYGYLKEIEVQREDQKLYKFMEGDFLRLNLRDIEDMLLLLVQKKLFNLERDVIFDLNVALQMFTKRVFILKRVEDLQLGVKSYQKKLNTTRLETFSTKGVIYVDKFSKTTPYNNPQRVIYVDKYKRNMLMHSDELYKFSDGTLTSVRSVLRDVASNLRMDYLPKRRWSTLDKQRSCIMIKAIDKLQLERRLMRNLEKFVGGREYREDFRLFERTI
ncbi:hypothetical protein Tco_1476981 [Tanacetum coccineum]